MQAMSSHRGIFCNELYCQKLGNPCRHFSTAPYDWRTDEFLAIAAILVLLAPLHFRVTYLLNHLDSPDYLCEAGVIILRQEALDSCAEIIGTCSGAAICRAVTFKGMEYEFARVVSPRYKARIDENEQYLDPGLLYLFCRFMPTHAIQECRTSNGSRLIS
jgi:hypothetical protein